MPPSKMKWTCVLIGYQPSRQDEPSCPLRISHGGFAKSSLSGRTINPLSVKLNQLRWLNIGLVLFCIVTDQIKTPKKKLTNIPPTFLSSSPCLPFGCFIQVIGCIACSGRSAKTSEAWVWMQWTLTKDNVYCSFLITWHSLDHSDEH